MSHIACFTSFTLGYLPRARVLARSLRTAHPDGVLYALLVDTLPEDLSAFAEFDHVLPAAALGIEDFPAWLFRHDLVEACTAVKGAMLQRLLDDGAEVVIYLDPDIAVFAPLLPVLEALHDASVVLTPHQITPAPTAQARADNEMTSQLYGIFNLGFLAVRNDAPGRAFAAWWAARLHEACYDDITAGLFTDQRYCDLAPALFDKVHILRDAGCNVASWNLISRPLSFTGAGALMAGPDRLRFYHFSKIGGIGSMMSERYAGSGTEVHELLAWYLRMVRSCQADGLEHRSWAYGVLADGSAIPRAARLHWRAAPALPRAFGDPFTNRSADFLGWIGQFQSHPGNDGANT